MAIHVTKLGHSCVRLERDGQTLVIDPGGFSEEDAAVGADAVLITHEHPDHSESGRLRLAIESKPNLEIWTNPAFAATLGDIGAPVHAVGEGDAFTAAGFDVSVHGERHGVIHPSLPMVSNVGFLVDGAVFHPGDAFTVPGVPVEALFVPVHAPWFKASEAIDYMREVAPTRSFAAHDGMLNDRGLNLVDMLYARLSPEASPYERLQAGESIDLG
jgi:L-ascorbate metabolism protein UlaG (beta-lactamase superfamily)